MSAVKRATVIKNKNINDSPLREGQLSDKDFSNANKYPFVISRYAKKLVRDAAIPTFLIALTKYFHLWDNYAINYNLFTPFPTILSSILPSSIATMTLTSKLFAWMSTEAFFFVFLSVLLHEFVYFTQVLFYSFIESFNLFSSFKLRREGVPNPSRTLIRNTIKEIPISHFIVQPLFYFTIFPFMKYFGTETFTSIPNLISCFYQFFFISIITDMCFYFIHRFSHSPSFYQHHKKHHQYKKPTAIAADYCTFMEKITLWFTPLVLGPLLFGSHTAVWLAWLMFRTYESIEAHSGYEFPYVGLNTSRFTDYHYARNLGNYGIGDFWDSICGTNIAYLRHLHQNPDIEREQSVEIK